MVAVGLLLRRRAWYGTGGFGGPLRFSTWLAYSFIFYDTTDAVKLDPLLSPAHKLFYGAGFAGSVPDGEGTPPCGSNGP